MSNPVNLKARMNRPASKQRLRVWLQVLKMQRQMETVLRDKLRLEFDTTLPRFDVMAALDYSKDGLRMSELSSFLKVSNGNVTGIVDRLVQDGSVVRVPVEGDRRAMLVRLTRKGREDFSRMAQIHEGWVNELLGALTPEDADLLIGKMQVVNKTMGDVK
jgi:DNA-binding MarR family transcriptional regulator